MKQIGMTNEGKAIIEMDVVEAAQLQRAVTVLQGLSEIQLNFSQKPEVPVLTVSPGERVFKGCTVSINSDGKAVPSEPTKAAKTGRKRNKPKQGRACVICGKPCPPRATSCSKACRMEKNRRYSEAFYRRKHPGAVSKPRKPAPPVAVALGKTTGFVDRLDLIRQANDRVNRLRAEEAG